MRSALHTALHLGSTATVAVDQMMRDDVPRDVQALLLGQSVLIDALQGDLLPAYANSTLRQRDLLLEESSLPLKERETLRRLPLFDREVFPADLQALDYRLVERQARLDQNLAFQGLARLPASLSALTAKGTAKPKGKAKQNPPQPMQTQTTSQAPKPAYSKPKGKGKKSAATKKKVFQGGHKAPQGK